MIIPNGYIKIKTSTGGGFENGKPKKAIVLSSGFIEANINESSRSHGQLGDETTGTRATYTILIDPYRNTDIWTNLEELIGTCYGLGIWRSTPPWKGLIKWVEEEDEQYSEIAETWAETHPTDAIAVSDRDKVEVFDGRMALLGTFEIQSARFLEFTEVIKIQV